MVLLVRFFGGGINMFCHDFSFAAPGVSSALEYTWPSGPTYIPVPGSYSKAAIGGGGGPDGSGGSTCPGGSSPGLFCGPPWPVYVAFGSPFQFHPSFSGTYAWSLSHILTVGARLPG